MKIAVLGGAGFIGSAIVDRLLVDRHEIRVFERPRILPYRKFTEDEKVEWITGDLLNIHDLSNAIDGVDVVMHLVSTTLPKSSNDDMIYDVESNLVATLRLLEQMRLKKIPKIVFISSGGTIYGHPEYSPIDEKHPTNPLVSYGITKLAIEKYLILYEHLHGIKSIILRVANPYGERQRLESAQGAVGVFLKKAILNEPIEIWGDGSITRDYIYISDVAEAFAQSITYNGKKSIFNIGSGKGTNLNEIIVLINKALNRNIDYSLKPGRSFDVPSNVLDRSLAFKELGWSPKVNLADGIEKTATWIRMSLDKQI
jgi:UDP-glucose 4-epimerase